ncbi:ABC transporter ATP-binding protein [Acidovorax sp. D2M1]|uniref:ABC transporter ATP-binding protein n=1 Tax=Acidovorax benzenivorans TaxID=2987520 RepID=A0ABT5RYW4_9BURK|nr:ATP-binding cassette domain-containing protein [Acidovorax benzenivorans]MDD2178894.1 ABC transporter ATP-binding protein [Acidovorax benzenivorans]
MTESVFLWVKGLRFSYPECAVLDNLSLAWPSGLALVRGDESTGKTTLLRLLAGELTAQAGSITLQGADLNQASKASAHQVFWADPRSGELDPLTARGWLDSLPARYPRWDAAAVMAHIEGFTLHEHLDKPFYALSTGSKRKVLMAGALASNAPLTLIDEPVGGLDKPSIRYLAQALASQATRPDRLIVVAHYEALADVPWGSVVDLVRL